MSMVPGMRGHLFGAVAAEPDPIIMPVGHFSGSSASSTISIGKADPDRYVIVSVGAHRPNGGTGRSITGVTIGGIAATQLVVHTATFVLHASIWIAAVPTGTTASVVLTHTGFGRFSVQAYRVVGLSSATPTDTDTELDGLNELELTVPAGGFAVGIVMQNGLDASPPPFTLPGLTEDYAALLVAPLTSYYVHGHMISVAGEALSVPDTSDPSDYSGGQAAGVAMV